jgi:uncharacterized protein YkwD
MRFPSRAALPLLATAALVACGGDSHHPLAPTAVPDTMHGPSTPDDIDGDGIANAQDDCPSVANADQRDACNYDAPAPAPTGNAAPDGVAYLSWVRAQVGLGPVTEDPTLSHGCAVHLAYLQQYSAEVGHPVLAHEEDLSKPYASAEGNQAGIDSVLALGNSTIAAHIDVWINSLYHRLPLLHPGLGRIGVAITSDGYGCIQYRPGTDRTAHAPHPIMWPPPDIQYTDRTFRGNEGPCPTAADPFNAATCPGSGAIATLGLNGLGALTAVTATMHSVTNNSDVSLFATYYDGGPTMAERQGYIGGSVALVPQPGSTLDRGTYEVTVNASVGGAATTYRWRFRTAAPLPTDTACVMGHGTTSTALPLDHGDQPGRVCADSVAYLVGGSGARTVTMDYDPAMVDLDMEHLDPATGQRLAVSDGTSGTERLVVPAGHAVRVYGFNHAMGAFSIRVQ